MLKKAPPLKNLDIPETTAQPSLWAVNGQVNRDHAVVRSMYTDSQ